MTQTTQHRIDKTVEEAVNIGAIRFVKRRTYHGAYIVHEAVIGGVTVEKHGGRLRFLVGDTYVGSFETVDVRVTCPDGFPMEGFRADRVRIQVITKDVSASELLEHLGAEWAQ